MIADELFPVQTRSWWLEHAHRFVFALTPLPCLVFAWWVGSQAISQYVWLGLISYSLAHLLIIGVQHRTVASGKQVNQSALDGLRFVFDSLFALFLIAFSPSLGSAIYPLYLVLALRVLAHYQLPSLASLVPFAFGMLYVFIAVQFYAAAFVPWALLLGSVFFGMLMFWGNVVQKHENALLVGELKREKELRAARVSELERTTNDIRARMRELHALEEGLRVITSTLSLDEVLSQIVDSTSQLLGPHRVHGMTLSLLQGDNLVHRALMPDPTSDPGWVVGLAQRTMKQATPLIISDATVDPELHDMLPNGIRAALCVPLFVGEGPARGTITVVSSIPSAFTSNDARHLTAFAFQAGIAINNAEMHSQLYHQQQLLQAVISDINDGLVVIDSQDNIVLANPIGNQLLSYMTSEMSVHDELLALANQLRSEKLPMMAKELQVVPEEPGEELVYQALASRVNQDNGVEPLTAIVLHDITAQKIQERERSEFISMVSHELRNPLNSLNGFLKIVLQGRAGPLNEQQQEFLSIADSQIEQLKGRIAELLEYNRLEAGQLVLDPKWNDLPLLVSATATRLRLQAEQAGLELINEVSDDLPECYFDSERIGQVLTNLIENAIKATPPGGQITLRSELHENELWVRVYDTGVGIPAEDLPKVFQRYFRAHNRTSSQGNHLGLGLAICQQIIEGHHGRIWVESQEGKGSCFSFSLTPIERARSANG